MANMNEQKFGMLSIVGSENSSPRVSESNNYHDEDPLEALLSEYSFLSDEEDEDEEISLPHNLKFTSLDELKPMTNEEELLEEQMALLEKTQTHIRYYLNEIKNNLQ